MSPVLVGSDGAVTWTAPADPVPCRRCGCLPDRPGRCLARLGYYCERIEPDLCSGCSLPAISERLVEGLLWVSTVASRLDRQLAAGRIEEPSLEMVARLGDLAGEARAVADLAQRLRDEAERAHLPPEPDAPADPGATRPPAPPRSQGPRGGAA